MDVLSLLLLACVVVPLLRWSRNRARYELAASGSSAAELSSVSHTAVGGPRGSDGAMEDRPVVLDRHAHEQLLDTQQQVLTVLADLTSELRTLQTSSNRPAADTSLSVLGRQTGTPGTSH